MSSPFIFVSIQDVTGDLQAQLTKFSCGAEDIDQFLVDDAKLYAEHGITNTTVVWLETDVETPAAYFSLSNDVVHLSGVESFELGLPFEPPTSHFPAVRITKFAVHLQHQGTGLAQAIMNHVEGMVFTSRGMSAVRLLTLDSVTRPAAQKFYKKVGFSECAQDARMHRQQKRKATIPMYKDLYAEEI